MAPVSVRSGQRVRPIAKRIGLDFMSALCQLLAIFISQPTLNLMIRRKSQLDGLKLDLILSFAATVLEIQNADMW